MSQLPTYVRDLIIVTIVGLSIRFILAIFLTYPRDIESWVTNSENFLMNQGPYGLPGHYYTPVWGYVIAILTMISGYAGIPLTQYNAEFSGGVMTYPWYTELPTLEYALLIKLFLFVIDLLVAYALFGIVKHTTSDNRKAAIAFSVWFLFPLTIVISSIRVMFENLEILLLLLSFLTMLKQRYALSGIMLGFSLLIKPFGIFAGILLIGYAYAQNRLMKQVVLFLAGVIVATAIVMIPVLISGDFQSSMSWLFARSENLSQSNNSSLLLFPPLIVLSTIVSLIISRYGMKDFRLVAVLSLALTGAMLIVAGNVQYYLVLLPFCILVLSRETVPVVFLLVLMSFLALISFWSWSSQLYVSTGWWGSDMLKAIGDFLYPYETKLDYDAIKSMTGVIAVVMSALILYKHRRHGNEG